MTVLMTAMEAQTGSYFALARNGRLRKCSAATGDADW